MGLQFKGKLILRGILTTFTGLTIGKDSVGTGNSSMPRTVVRHPISGVPFIPATSLRGAVRRLLEKRFYPNGSERRPLHACKDGTQYQKCPICQLFGVKKSYLPNASSGKTVFRDVFLTEESVKRLLEVNRQAYLTDIKVYACMDRVTSQGNSYALEQIPAGSHFAFEILYTLAQEEDTAYFSDLLQGLYQLEITSLGSHGSRGLGKVRFGEWAVDKFHCIGTERETGLSLLWRPRGYYESGTGERCLIEATDKLSIEEMISKYEEAIPSLWR